METYKRKMMTPPRLQSRRGAILLEVIFSIALLAGACAAIIGGFNACAQANRDLWMESKAADLAVTMLTEMQMGVVPPEDDGPTDYADPLADWCWQVVTADLPPQTLDGPTMRQVQIVVTYKPDSYSYTLMELVNVPGATVTGTPSATGSDTGTGTGTGAGAGTGRGAGTGSGAGAGAGRGTGTGSGAGAGTGAGAGRGGAGGAGPTGGGG
jgi:hypothetical protein